jgi:hypothetical protein
MCGLFAQVEVAVSQGRMHNGESTVYNAERLASVLDREPGLSEMSLERMGTAAQRLPTIQ